MEQNPLHEDNQQESSRVKDLSWLGGIIDGEGTITIRYKRRRNQSSILQPVFTIVNTDFEIIDNIERILKEEKIPYWVSKSKQTKNWKPRKIVEISGIKRLSRFLPLMEEYLVGKKKECQIVKDWCLYRLGKRPEYSDKDIKLVIELKKLHGHQDEIDYRKLEKLLKSSETTR